MSIYGYSDVSKLSEKILGYDEDQYKVRKNFVTVAPCGSGVVGMDVLPKAMFPTTAIAKIVEAQTTSRVLKCTAHGARVGDVVRFVNGLNESIEARVNSIPDANTVILASKLENAPGVGDNFFVMRFITLTLDKDGRLSTSSGPMQFIRDGLAQQVIEDTVTPANSRPMPVLLHGATGTINITAGDLNVQNTHTGANPDSMQIGNGTDILEITAANEAKTSDANAKLSLDAILAKLAATPATEAKQDTLISGLGSIISELQDKADLTETQPVSIATLPLAAGTSTEAKQDVLVTSLANLLTELEAKADVTETQPVSLASTPLAIGASSATGQGNIVTALNTLLTELQAKADLAETQPVSMVGAATEAKQDDLISALGSSLNVSENGYHQDFSTVNLTTTFITAVTLTANLKKVKVLNNSGGIIYIKVDAGKSAIIGAGNEVEISLVGIATNNVQIAAKDSTILGGNVFINFLG